jgi:AraC-like DNA-binding protein
MQSLGELREFVVRRAGAGLFASHEEQTLGLKFVAARHVPEPRHHVYQPVFSLVVQGEKRAMLGRQLFTCRAGHFLVASVDLPLTIHVANATPQRPFLALAMTLSPAKVASLLLETGVDDGTLVEPAGLGVSVASHEFVDAMVRLVRLLDTPKDLPVLAPLIERELLWRLLRSEQGARVRQIGVADGRLSQIGRAMRWMREHYTRTLRIEELARAAGMSTTSFHRHFRAVALMSPLQYIKQIRLQEARARLLAGAADVAGVGLAVGYDSASQFSREYKRTYGSPPGQDARELRAAKGDWQP